MNANLSLLIILIILTAKISLCDEESTMNEYRRIVHEARKNPDDAIIGGKGIVSGIGDIVRRLGRRQGENSPEANELFQKAQTTLLAIPSHAEYYAKRINDHYEKSMENAELINQSYLCFDHDLGYCFQTLRHLPSPETVRVLGDMLDDMRSMDRRGRNPKDWTIDSYPSHPHGWMAASILTQMELSGAPMKQFIFVSDEEKNRMTAEEYYKVNIEPWRLWYAQVKAGTRTFRFKGSDVEYNLDGPVRTGAVAPSLRKDAGEAAGPAETDRTSPWPLIGSLLVLAAAGGWYFVRGRASRVSS